MPKWGVMADKILPPIYAEARRVGDESAVSMILWEVQQLERQPVRRMQTEPMPGACKRKRRTETTGEQSDLTS